MRTSRHRTPSIEIEDAVVDAALRLLATKSPAALTVRGLAAEAGIAPMGIYNHFGDKNGVIDVVVRRGFEDLTASVSIGLAADDAVDGLRAGLHAYRGFAMRHRTTYAVMFLREVPNFVISDSTLEVATRSFGVLTQGVERAMRSGDLRRDDPVAIAQQLWAATHGAVALELTDLCLVDDANAVYSSLVETMLAGLGPVRAEAAARGARRAHVR
jgi:AcrR family transcriptional regulator